MTTAPTSTEGVPSTWRRFVQWFKQLEEAVDFDISEYHERRIARLELEVAALRSKSPVSGNGASSRADKEVS